MGFVVVKVGLETFSGAPARTEVELTVDTGALYTMIPGRILRDIGIEPTERLDFETANGQLMYRDVGEARFSYNGRKAISKVIFGEERDASVLGVVTMEAMGLEVDPVNKILRPARLIMY